MPAVGINTPSICILPSGACLLMQRIIRSSNLCYSCLAPGHQTTDCRSSGRCCQCNMKLHTSLHRDNDNNSTPEVTVVQQYTDPSAQSTVVNAVVPTVNAESTFQMTSLVILEAARGQQIRERALVDSGASISMITSRVVQQLHLSKLPNTFSNTGAQGAHSGSIQHSVAFKIRPINHSSP